jgi:alpha-mannosidase
VWDGQKKIQVNTVFPFKIEHPKLTYEVPFGAVEYGKESPSSKASHPTVRATNNWINLSNDQMGITLATDVTPFDVKDRNDPRFHDARNMQGENKADSFSMYFGGDYKNFNRVEIQDPLLLKTDFVIQPILLRSVFSCGDKNLYFEQEGEHKYQFAIRTYSGTLIPYKEVQFGQEHNSPLIVMEGKKSGGNLPDSNFFLEVSEPNVIVTILKKAEDGSGMVLRCYETDGRDTDLSITLLNNLKSAEQTNIIEQEGKEIGLKDGKLRFHIGAHAIETFKLKFD